MLRERAQGVPCWCEQLLLDMTEKKQLIVTYDDGSNAMRENTIAPNAAQLKKVFSDHSLEEILDENDNDEIEYNRVSASFKVKEDEVALIILDSYLIYWLIFKDSIYFRINKQS